MKYYFIDFENVHDNGFTGLEKIDKNSIIYLLYTDACKNVSITFLEKVLKNEIQVKLCKTETGKNALDFQLSSLLGYTIKENERQPVVKRLFGKQSVPEQTEKQEYYIVSKDTGFDAVVEFWKQQNVNISRVHNLSGDITVPTPVKKAQALIKKVTVKAKEPAKTVKQQEPKVPKKKAVATIQQVTKEELQKYLSEEEYNDKILNIVNNYKTKTAINNGLVQLFKDTNKAGATYNKIKPLLKEKGRT